MTKCIILIQEYGKPLKILKISSWKKCFHAARNLADSREYSRKNEIVLFFPWKLSVWSVIRVLLVVHKREKYDDHEKVSKKRNSEKKTKNSNIAWNFTHNNACFTCTSIFYQHQIPHWESQTFPIIISGSKHFKNSTKEKKCSTHATYKQNSSAFYKSSY